MAVQPLFATPFASVPVPRAATLNEALAGLIAGAAAAGAQPDATSSPLRVVGTPDFFERPEGIVQQLRREILRSLCEAVMEACRYDAAQFARLILQARAHFVVIRPDGWLPLTRQPNSSWSAVYCVQAPPRSGQRVDSAALRFYDQRLQGMYLDAGNTWMRPPFGIAHHLWYPTPGYLAAFPSATPYEIALNRSAADLILVVAAARFESEGHRSTLPW